MTRVLAFIEGCSRVGQSTILAELAFELVKRGSSVCILTAKRSVEAKGFDCFELAGLAPPGDRGQRDPAALAADLAQLEDYDIFLLDLPSASADLAIAAGLSGAELVVPIRLDQGALGEIGAVFKALARRPPPRPFRLVLNQVRDAAGATAAAERLLVSLAKRFKIEARLSAILPWDPGLSALDDSSALASTTLPTTPLVRAIPPLADALSEDADNETPTPVATAFWEQFQTHLQQPASAQPGAAALAQPDTPSSAQMKGAITGQRKTAAPVTAHSTKPPEPGAPPPAPGAQAAPAPGLPTELARIAAGLEQLTAEVRQLRHGLATKFGFAEDADGETPPGGADEPIRMDFEAFRRSRGKTKTDE
jgi:hypothetical protein